MTPKPRTLQDINDHPMVESTHTEWDGCFTDSLGREIQGRWVYLKDGFICPDMECGTIHEPTIKACCELLANCRPMTNDEMENAYGVTINCGACTCGIGAHTLDSGCRYD